MREGEYCNSALYYRQIGKGSLGHGEAGDVEGLAGQDRLDRCRHIGEAFAIIFGEWLEGQ